MPRNPSNCTILNSCVVENFILAVETFGKVLQNLEICVLVNNNSCGRLVSSLELPTTFDKRFRIILVYFLFLILTY